jgi:hypothetical protein
MSGRIDEITAMVKDNRIRLTTDLRAAIARLNAACAVQFNAEPPRPASQRERLVHRRIARQPKPQHTPCRGQTGSNK